jgi:hypothetical protein
MLDIEDLKLSDFSNDDLTALIKYIKNRDRKDQNYPIPPTRIRDFCNSNPFDMLKLYQRLVDELVKRFEAINKDKLDPKYLGIPNINFGYEVNDDRKERFKKQRLERGFDDSEMWSLYSTISHFILPRLKDYRECIEEFGIHPYSLKSVEKWLELLDKMILAFELKIYGSMDSGMEMDEYNKKIDEGLKAFTKWFSALWY